MKNIARKTTIPRIKPSSRLYFAKKLGALLAGAGGGTFGTTLAASAVAEMSVAT
jgi:hypothetical protein